MEYIYFHTEIRKRNKFIFKKNSQSRRKIGLTARSGGRGHFRARRGGPCPRFTPGSTMSWNLLPVRTSGMASFNSYPRVGIHDEMIKVFAAFAWASTWFSVF